MKSPGRAGPWPGAEAHNQRADRAPPATSAQLTLDRLMVQQERLLASAVAVRRALVSAQGVSEATQVRVRNHTKHLQVQLARGRMDTTDSVWSLREASMKAVGELQANIDAAIREVGPALEAELEALRCELVAEARALADGPGCRTELAANDQKTPKVRRRSGSPIRLRHSGAGRAGA